MTRQGVFLIFLVAHLIASPSFAQTPVNDATGSPLAIQTVHRLTLDGQTYTAVVVTVSGPHWKLDPGDSPAGQRAARALVERARKWAIEQYLNRYPELDPSFFHEMEKRDPILDGQSAYVILLNGNEHNAKIKGSLRISWSDEVHPKLPSERLFDGFSFIQPPVEQHKYPDRSSLANIMSTAPKDGSADSFESTVEKMSATYPVYKTGGLREFKQLVVDPDVKADLVPVLLYYAEDSMETYFNEPFLPQKFEHAGKNFEGHDMLGVTDYLYPWKYVLTCNKRMIPYYRKLGFELMQEGPIEGDNYAMSINRKDFFENTILKRMRARPGYASLIESHNSELKTGMSGPMLAAKFIAPFVSAEEKTAYCEKLLVLRKLPSDTDLIYRQGK